MRYIVKSYFTDQHGKLIGIGSSRTYNLEQLCEVLVLSSHWVQQQGVGLIMDGEHPYFGGWIKVIAIPEYIQVVQ